MQDKDSRTKFLLYILVISMMLLTVLLIVYRTVDKKEHNMEATKEPSNSPTYVIIVTPSPTPEEPFFGTPTPEYTEEPEITQEPTSEPTNAPTTVPTATPTNVPEKTGSPTPTAAPTPTPSKDNIYKTDVNPTAGTAMDYSFLKNVSTDYFHDINIRDVYSSGKYKDKLCGSWWSGTEIKDSNGVITDVKRSTETENLIKKYNGCYVDRNSGKTVYLTFDCGYENGNTEKILDTLKEKNVKAIFFVTSQFFSDSRSKALCERMIAEGHLIGNHTWNHPNMMLENNDTFVKNITENEKRLNELLGYEYKMTFYRPPEGASSERDLALAKELGYRTVFWSFAYADYNADNQMEPSKALNSYLKAKIHPGAVYLLHAVSSTNAEILGDFIDYGRENGYTFARLDSYGA